MILYFDIETGPLPDDQMPPPPVKLGNLKDPDKIAAKYREKAALDATTGQVLAIGYATSDGNCGIFGCGDEAENLDCFWYIYRRSERAVGFCIDCFDMPFLIRRSMVLGVPYPRWHKSSAGTIDLAEEWRLGVYGYHVSLNSIAHAFGLAGKLEGVDGSQFADLWRNDRDKAIAYLERDVELVRELADRMGVT